MSKFLEGYSDPCYTRGEWWADSHGEVIAMPAQVKVAGWFDGANPEQASANRQLASAAPDMYVALKQCLEVIDALMPGVTKFSTQDYAAINNVAGASMKALQKAGMVKHG